MELSDLYSLLNAEEPCVLSNEYKDETPPLQKSLLNGSVEEIQQVLESKYGIRLSSHNDWGRKCQEIVDVCIEQKLDVNSETNKYSTLLHFVLENFYEDFHSVINRLNNFNINALNDQYYYTSYNETLIHLAIIKGRKNVVKILLEFGADVNVKNHYPEKTPLFYAVSTAQIEVVEMLLKAGANVNAENKRRLKPIHYAFGKPGRWYDFNYGQKLPFEKLIELLCTYGADLNFNNVGGSIALCDACKAGSLNEIKFLLQHGACFDSHSTGHLGYTPLYNAVIGNSVNFVDFLLSNGADLKTISLNAEEPPIFKLAAIRDFIYYYAVDNGSSSDSVELLFHYGDFPLGNLESTIQGLKRAADMIEFLVDNGANVNVFDQDELSPLDRSIADNSVEIVECLLELNAEIDNEINYQYLFYYHDCIIQNPNLYCDRVDACVLLTAFLATKKDDISHYIIRPGFDWVLPFFAQCKIQVNQMKKRAICENRSVTYFDFLTQDLMKVTVFYSSEEIMSVLESGKHKLEFPCYKYLFEKRIERVKKLKECEKNVLLCLQNYFKHILPFVVVNEIFSYLSAGDLRNVGRALSKVYTNENSLHMRCIF